MSVNKTIYLKQGDTTAWPALTIEEAGAAKDLTTATSVVVYMRELTATTNKIDGSSVTITDAANGIVTFTPTAADMDTAGVYKAEFLITWSDAKVTTWPNNTNKKTDNDYVRVEIASNLQ